MGGRHTHAKILGTRIWQLSKVSSVERGEGSYFHGRTESNGREREREFSWRTESNSTDENLSWLKSFSGRMHSLEIDEVLSRVVKTWKTKQLCVGASSFVHRRMVHNTSRRNHKNGEKLSSALQEGVKYNVIRIDCDGCLQHLELRPAQLGVHPRDVDLLSSSTFIPQRGTIAVQRDKVLVRMENVRAIVYKDHVLLFDAHHPPVTREGVFVSPERPKESSSQRGRDAFAESLERLKGSSFHRERHAFAESLAKNAKEISSALPDAMPFHLRVIESLLEETSNFFHKKVDRLKLVVERILHEITYDVSMGGLKTLLPLRRAVTEVEHDVRDAHEAMDQVLRSDENLQALCLVNDDCSMPTGVPSAGPKQQQQARYEGGPHASGGREDDIYRLRQAAVDMLLTYQREVDDAGGVLEELRKGMEAAQEVWELGLDTTRNRMIRLNLYISVFTSSLTVATLPAALFGMNLISGLEEHPEAFYWVLGAALTAPVVMLGVLAVAFQVWPKIVDKRRAQDLAGLLDLLRHLDSVDDIVEAVTREVKSSKITRKEFHGMLRSHHLAQVMRKKELDLIFRMFDHNRDEVLEAEEMRSSSSESKSRSSPNRHRT